MTKRQYFKVCRDVARSDPKWCIALLAAAERGETPELTPHHERILRLALRSTSKD